MARTGYLKDIRRARADFEPQSVVDQIRDGHHVVFAIPKASKVRRLLQRNPGYELVEVHHPKTCSGKCEYAAEKYEHFHGGPSQQLLEGKLPWPPPAGLQKIFGQAGSLPRTLTALGELARLLYEDEENNLKDVWIRFDHPLPLLITDYARAGKEALFVIGGSYRTKPGVLGPVHYVEYNTIKSFEKNAGDMGWKHWFDEPWPMLGANDAGTQLYIFRGQSQFFIDRSEPVSAGIVG